MFNCQEHSQDASLVATVLTAILKELHGEIGVLDNCRQFMGEFTNMKAGIQPWLDTEPNFEEIQECRKTIRTLKSKLRHKEADRQDMEEVCRTRNYCVQEVFSAL